jgi:hypothetical protein
MLNASIAIFCEKAKLTDNNDTDYYVLHVS